MRKHARIHRRTRSGHFGYDMLTGPFGQLCNWPGNEFHRDDWTPNMTATETGDDITIATELPGIDPDDIDITVRGNVLTISGENKQWPPDDTEDYYHVRHLYGRFKGSIDLPEDMDLDSTKASYHDGILKISLHRINRTEARHVPITV